jgi:hypothetical protein
MTEARWYCVDSIGGAEICPDQKTAEGLARIYDYEFPGSTHKAVQLVDAAELEAANARIAELESQLKVARGFMLND